MSDRPTSPGALTWTDDASRGALARRLYDRIRSFCCAEAGERHVPALLQAIDEAIEGEATARSASHDQKSFDLAGSQWVRVYTDALPGHRLLVLDIIRILMQVNLRIDVGTEFEGYRPHLEFIMTPTLEAQLRKLALPHERLPLVSTPAYVPPVAEAQR